MNWEDRQLRVITNVTANPTPNTNGINEEYVGRVVPTAHATLEPENFALEERGETLLKGDAGKGADLEQLTNYHISIVLQVTQNTLTFRRLCWVSRLRRRPKQTCFKEAKPTTLVTITQR